MAEILTLTTPITFPTPPTITTYLVRMLKFDYDTSTIDIRLTGPNGEVKTFDYSGPTALTLMIALNKANLSTTSLQKRVLQQLVADGKLAGTISGSPD
jgi:hypothetical protein